VLQLLLILIFWQIIEVISQLLSVGQPIEWIRDKLTHIAQLLGNLCKQKFPFSPYEFLFFRRFRLSNLPNHDDVSLNHVWHYRFLLSTRKGCILILWKREKGSIFLWLPCEARDKDAFALIDSGIWWDFNEMGNKFALIQKFFNYE